MGSSVPEKTKRLKALKLTDTSMDIDEMIHLASRKLYPIIEMLVGNSTLKGDQLLTREEFDDTITASNIIKDISKILIYADFKINTKHVDFGLEKHKNTLNDQGKIYVKTGLLLQLIDLYNFLEDIKDLLNDFYRSIGVHSFVQTESGLSICSEDSTVNPNNIVVRLNKSLKNGNSLGFFQKNFIVMPSATDMSNDEVDNIEEILPLRGSKSEITENLERAVSRLSTKKVKSTGSITQEEISEVTDVYGAKRVVVRCICDLQEVSRYLGIERKDVATICSRVEVDNLPTLSKQKSELKTKSFHDDTIHQTEDGIECCCPECFAEVGSKRDFQECDDDKVIICIKGCNENEGDVQIVIRQCPECKKAKESPYEKPDTASDRSDQFSLTKTTKSQSKMDKNRNMKSIQNIPSRATQSTKSIQYKPSVMNRSMSKSAMDPSRKLKSSQSIKSIKSNKSFIGSDEKYNPPVDVESLSLHNQDSQGSIVCSEESDEEKTQNDLLSSSKSRNILSPSKSRNVMSPSKSQTSRIRRKDPSFLAPTISKSSVGRSRSSAIKQPNIQRQARVECSKIQLFQTTNLCLQTDTGQELIISVTVTPREYENKKLSLKDIFSEDDYGNQGRIDEKDYYSVPPEEPTYYKKRRRSAESTDSRSVSLPDPQERPSYYVEDRVIPLERTKICSSVDFDVTTLESRIRDKGFQNKNAKIVVQLKELGIDNLLRACRPAKCCRKAVLNEKMKKCLPYPPSLRSLPLDEDDIRVIKQSLQMSLQKVKNSTDLNKDFYTNYTYSKNPIRTIMYFFVEGSKNNLESVTENDIIRKKLNYYINLVNDIEIRPRSEYEILYFGVEGRANERLNKGVKEDTNESNQNIFNKSDFVYRKRDKYNKYEERPMLTGYTNIGRGYIHYINNSPKLLKNERVLENNQAQIFTQSEMNNVPTIKNRKTKMISKIPRYRGNNRSACLNMKNNYNIEKIEQEVYDISLDTLLKEEQDNSSGGKKAWT